MITAAFVAVQVTVIGIRTLVVHRPVVPITKAEQGSRLMVSTTAVGAMVPLNVSVVMLIVLMAMMTVMMAVMTTVPRFVTGQCG